MPDETPKIIVDDDWKSQARAEKEKLAAQDAKAKAQAPAAEQGLPEEITFDEVIRVLATQALMYLGAYPDPQTGKAIIALDLAKMHIDMLGVLQDKTKGNLTPEEKKNLDEATHALRLQFSEIVRALEQAAAEGRLGKGGIPGMPGMAGPGQPGL